MGTCFLLLARVGVCALWHTRVVGLSSTLLPPHEEASVVGRQSEEVTASLQPAAEEVIENARTLSRSFIASGRF